jgi:hypothetical protein
MKKKWLRHYGFMQKLTKHSSTHFPQVVPPQIVDINDRQNFLKLLVERMQHNPIPPAAPQVTREMLHERRVS